MKLGLLLKGAVIGLALAGAASSAHAATAGWNVKTSPTWLYVWANGVGSTSGNVYNYGTYTWNRYIPEGTMTQIMCQSSNGTAQWYGNIYGTKIVYCK